MSDLLGRQALVIGAGMSGLAAAGALAEHFEQVIVLERDLLADTPAHRPGTPQSRQLHGLLSGGLDALCQTFPRPRSGPCRGRRRAAPCQHRPA